MRTRARTHVKMITLAAMFALTSIVATGTSDRLASINPAHAATTGAAATIPALGTRWFALGASLPAITHRCDFGCGRSTGVRGRQALVDKTLRDMSRRGVRVARWHLFADDAWQVRRRADGTPTGLVAATLLDLDVAVRLAEKHDVYLLPVVLPEPRGVPVTWFTDQAQATALAATLRPMFARYRGNRHVLGWELVSGAEVLQDDGVATAEQLRSHASVLIAAARQAAPPRLVALGATNVSRLDIWTGLGASFYLPQDVGARTGETCASCRTVAQLSATEGVDAPVVIGGFTAGSVAVATKRLRSYTRQGYAGALGWSWRGTPHAARPGAGRFPDAAAWRYHYDRARSGPRSKPLNPCMGPDRRRYRCPNLRMATPSSITLGRRGSRRILYSTNSLDSRGAGPASLRGVRDGRFTMGARQLLHRLRGGPISIDTGAKLRFKAIPGQFRYWKWDGAARMELWRLDSTGRPVERTRVGPKTVYCLRDLKRNFGWLPRAPRSRVYPGCSQRLSQRAVTLGTSVGWSDVYPASYHENWIDVTGLRGCFAYVHIADPDNVIYESDEDDNASRVVVKLPFHGSNRGCPGARPLPFAGGNGGW